MDREEIAAPDWFETVRDYTVRLVRISSVSPGAGERTVAEEALRILHEDGLGEAYAASGLDPLPGDLYDRANAFAFLRGASPRTVVMLGHIDTVGTIDYGPLEPWALDPLALAERQAELAALMPELRAVLEAHPGDVMLGRGVADMKSGVAVNLAVMRALARQARDGTLPLSVVCLATPDEENESAGVLQAVRFLLRLREEHGLDYLGAINTDTILPRSMGDPQRYIYTGTVGKLLPSFLVIGREAHAGVPFEGLDANLLAAELIRDLGMNVELCDVVRGQATPPPVTLHAADLKTHYDVQLAFAASFYLNVLDIRDRTGGAAGATAWARASQPRPCAQAARGGRAALAALVRRAGARRGPAPSRGRRPNLRGAAARGVGAPRRRADERAASRGRDAAPRDTGCARAQPASGPVPVDRQRTQRPRRRALLLTAVLSSRGRATVPAAHSGRRRCTGPS